MRKPPAQKGMTFKTEKGEHLSLNNCDVFISDDGLCVERPSGRSTGRRANPSRSAFPSSASTDSKPHQTTVLVVRLIISPVSQRDGSEGATSVGVDSGIRGDRAQISCPPWELRFAQRAYVLSSHVAIGTRRLPAARRSERRKTETGFGRTTDTDPSAPSCSAISHARTCKRLRLMRLTRPQALERHCVSHPAMRVPLPFRSACLS